MAAHRTTSPAEEASSTISRIPKACENCRLRKVRCNRLRPCSNCETSGIPCGRASPSVEADKRVSTSESGSLKRKVDTILERLSSIEDRIAAPRNEGPVPPPFHSGEIDLYEHHTEDIQGSRNENQALTAYPFHGNSSFPREAVRTTRIAGRTLNGIQPTPSLRHAFAALRNHLEIWQSPHMNGDVTFNRCINPGTPVPRIDLFPQALALKLIRRARASPTKALLCHSLRETPIIEEVARKVYFPIESLPPGASTVMHGLLSFMLRDAIDGQSPLVEEYDCNTYLQYAERKFREGIETYAVMAFPCYYHIYALMLAAIKAQNEFKSLLVWTMVSSAARHCVTLGYHRGRFRDRIDGTDTDDKLSLFWTVYTWDKHLTLFLGRMSNFLEEDIDATLFKPRKDPGFVRWDKSAITYLNLAKIEGRVYESLYSRGAMRKSPQERGMIINALSTMLSAWYDEAQHDDGPTSYYPELYAATCEPNEAIYHSLQTVIHRAATLPDSSFLVTPECCEAASKALKSHARCFVTLFHMHKPSEAPESGFVPWYIQYASLTPFLVIFLRTICVRMQEDVDLLKGVVQSLDMIKPLSKECANFFELCQHFANVADAVVKSEQEGTSPGLAAAQAVNASIGSTTFGPGTEGVEHVSRDLLYQHQQQQIPDWVGEVTGDGQDGVTTGLLDWFEVNLQSMMEFTDNTITASEQQQ